MAEKSISDLVTAVAKQNIDVALVRDLETVPSTCITQRYVTEKLFVLLPENHVLASRTGLSIQEIHPIPLIGFQDTDEVGIAHIVQTIAQKWAFPGADMEGHQYQRHFRNGSRGLRPLDRCRECDCASASRPECAPSE
ncbi:hypothetical protein RAA17_09020 [Komagataeibacter rhaeticus]|nr:hypothetical protein [Komagataeibacter rhaeticus]